MSLLTAVVLAPSRKCFTRRKGHRRSANYLFRRHEAHVDNMYVCLSENRYVGMQRNLGWTGGKYISY